MTDVALLIIVPTSLTRPEQKRQLAESIVKKLRIQVSDVLAAFMVADGAIPEAHRQSRFMDRIEGRSTYEHDEY